jgi:hypothetical protein
VLPRLPLEPGGCQDAAFPLDLRGVSAILAAMPLVPAQIESIKHRFVQANGIKIHIAEQGEGPLIVLAHGWPELWYSWRHVLPALAAAGYHAVAPDIIPIRLVTGQAVEMYVCPLTSSRDTPA